MYVMSFKRHQTRRHHSTHHHQRLRLLFASIICIMSIPKLAAAASFGIRRVGLAPAASSLSSGGSGIKSAFVSRYRHNAREPRPTMQIDVTKTFVGSDQSFNSGCYPMKSMQALSSVGDPTSQDEVIIQELTNKEEDLAKTRYFHCYLLRSADPEYPLKTYIGFTTNPQRRLRQHNGELVSGARRTKSGRPWEYVAVIDGFQDKVTAMQFEWAWQHVGRSKVFREAVGCDKLARKMKRKRGVKARLDELNILLNDCPPFNTFPLRVYFLESECRDLFCDVAEGADCMNMEICSLDEMPFAKGQPVRKELPRTESLSPMMGNALDLIRSRTSTTSLSKMIFGRSRPSIDSVTRNPLFRLGLRSKSSWALSAVAEANVHESQSDNTAGAVDANDQVKVPFKFKPYPFSYHKELTVRIDSLTNLGFGIARVELDENTDTDTMASGTAGISNEDHEKEHPYEPTKWVVFVPNVIPGELVQIRIYRNYASYSDADLLQIIEPSPDRIEPKCSLATICGGCQYQHIKIDRQRKMKTMQVQDLFERLGGFETNEFPTVLDTLGTEEVFGYRSKITPHYEAPMTKKERKKAQNDHGDTIASKYCEIGSIGFKQKASRRLVDVPFCHIATPAINDELEKVREDKREEARQGLLKKPTKGATLLLRDSDGVVETDHNVYVNATVKDLTFRFQAGNFFQNNPFMLPKMVDLVVDAATKESPSGKSMTHLIDCYCGSGLFALGSSSSFDVCVGIEVNQKAVEEARENAALNGIQNCDFVSASAEAIFQSRDPVRAVTTKESAGECENKDLLVCDFPRESTVVVVDPPRKGCSEEFLQQLNDYQPARVVYMSCDPATQARDAKLLVS